MSAFVLAVEGVALLLLLVSSAFFSSSETCLFSLDPIDIDRLRARHPSAAARIDRLLGRPTALLSAILIGNTLVNVAAAAVGFSLIRRLGVAHAEAVTIPTMTALLLIFGEVAPKRFAMRHSSRLAALYSLPLTGLVFVLAPVRHVLEWVTSIFSRTIQVQQSPLTEDEFLTLVEVGEEEGVLDEEERTMVDGIIALDELQASDVMTPRVDLVGINLSDPPETREAAAHRVRFRYLPVYRDTMDNIEGFLEVQRFLLSEGHDLQGATIRPTFVPETAPLDTLLATFMRENRRVAVVVDEFGGTAGLITRGDILEEIAEDVVNEYGDEHLTIQQISATRWLVDGSVSLEELNYELDMELEADGADRVGGWVTAVAEHIPRTGEVVEAQGCRATVQRLRKHRVMLVQIEKIPPAELTPPEPEAMP
jgi:putative hemolysin